MQVQPQFALGFLCKNAPDGGKNQRNVWVRLDSGANPRLVKILDLSGP